VIRMPGADRSGHAAHHRGACYPHKLRGFTASSHSQGLRHGFTLPYI
jgi:hypothetical protein